MGLLTISVSHKLRTSLNSLIDTQVDSVNEWQDGLYTLIDINLANGRSPMNLTNTLANLIFRQLSPILLQRILNLTYDYFNAEEQRNILAYAYRDLWSCPGHYYHLVCHNLANYLAHHNQINLEGFIRFRARDYWKFLEDTLDNAVDSYLIEQEYKEFVKLLSYFVELQEPKIDFVNVIFNSDDSFKILDYNGDQIETEYLENIILEIGDNGLDFEDLLISALITIAPAKLLLHVGHNSRPVHTVISIFGERAFICDRCLLCEDVDHIRK